MRSISTADRAAVADALPLRQLDLDPTDASAIVIYAPGQGRGHLTRALNLASLLGAATILHTSHWQPVARPGLRVVRVDPCDDPLSAWVPNVRVLVVDTFPAGLVGEVRPAHLRQVPCSVLMRRHLKTHAYPNYFEAMTRYTHRLRPYPEDACEWEGEGGGAAIGYLVRPLQRGPRTAPWSVLGRLDGVEPQLADYLARGHRIEGAFDTLPAQPIIAAGAGYNTTFELLTAGADFRLVPVAKRYDDPWRRADRLDRLIATPTELERYVAEAA